MQISIRQRLIVLIFSGLFVTLSAMGMYRYFNEKQAMLNNTRVYGEQSGKLMADLAAPLLSTMDYTSLEQMARNFMSTADAQELSIVDSGGREIVRVGRPSGEENRIVLGPFSIRSTEMKLGELRAGVYPADLEGRLRGRAVSILIEHLVVFFILVILFFSMARSMAAPIQELGRALKDLIERRDFMRRVDAERNDEIGALATGMNYLIERMEQFVAGMGAVASRINELSQRISKALQDIQQNSGVEAEFMSNVVSSVGTMSSSVQSVSESAESLLTSAEETSSAMLQMNSSNQEVSAHTGELADSVEEVSTSVVELMTAIREVAGHVETLSSSAEETSVSATEIESTIREVERAAKESSRLSDQVSAEARDIGVRSILEISNAMNKIKESVTSYSALVTRLGKRSEEIGNILGVILEVTERTNLLALNASILAAQAGEQGRGFAVVAEQIKALADRTAGSAQDIAILIRAVQKETREAVSAMTESLTAVDEGVSRSEEARAALDKILASSGRSAETANMIERAMGEQSRGIKQVSLAILNIKQMVNQIAAATEAQGTGTEMIIKASEEMRDSSRQVHKAVLEQQRGGKQIATAAENVSSRAAQIATSTREQGQIAERILDAMKQVQDLPRMNMKRMESLAAEVKSLEEQYVLLNRELLAMTAKGNQREITALEAGEADSVFPRYQQ